MGSIKKNDKGENIVETDTDSYDPSSDATHDQESLLHGLGRKFVEGGKEFGQRFYEGGQMAGVFPASKEGEGYSDFADVQGGSSTKPVEEPYKAPKSLVLDSEMSHGGAQDYQDAKNPQKVPLEVKKRLLKKLKGDPSDESAGLDLRAQAPSGPESAPLDPLGDLDRRNMSDRADLATAQAAAHRARSDAEGSNMIWRGFAMGTKTPVNEAMEKARLQDADQPLEDYAQRRELEDQNLKQAKTRYDVQQDVAKDDPANPLAQKAANFAVASGMMPPAMRNGFTLRQWEFMSAGHDALTAKQKADETARHNRADEYDTRRGQDIQLQIAALRQKGEEGDKVSGRASVLAKNLAQLVAAREAVIRHRDESLKTGIPANWIANVPGIGRLLAPNAAAVQGNAHMITGVAAGAIEGGVPSQGRMDTMRGLEFNGGDTKQFINSSSQRLLDEIGTREAAIRGEMAGMGLKHGQGDYALPQGGGNHGGIPDVMYDTKGVPHRWNGKTWVAGG